VVSTYVHGATGRHDGTWVRRRVHHDHRSCSLKETESDVHLEQKSKEKSKTVLLGVAFQVERKVSLDSLVAEQVFRTRRTAVCSAGAFLAEQPTRLLLRKQATLRGHTYRMGALRWTRRKGWESTTGNHGDGPGRSRMCQDRGRSMNSAAGPKPSSRARLLLRVLRRTDNLHTALGLCQGCFFSERAPRSSVRQDRCISARKTRDTA